MAFEQMQREVEKQDEKKVKEENENDEEATSQANDDETKSQANDDKAEAGDEAANDDKAKADDDKAKADDEAANDDKAKADDEAANDDEAKADEDDKAKADDEAQEEAYDEADDLNRHVMMVLVGNAVVTTLIDAAFDFGFVGDIVSNVVLLSFSFVALMKVARRNILSLIMLWTAVNGIWMNVVAYMRFNQVQKTMTTTLTLAVLSMPFLAFVYLNHHDVQEWMHLPLIIMFVISSILQGAWIGMGTCAVETPGNANLQGNVKTTASSITFALAALVVGVLLYRVRSIHLKGSQASRPEMLA